MNKIINSLLILIVFPAIIYAQTDWSIMAINTNPSSPQYEYINEGTNILRTSNGVFIGYGVRIGTNPTVTDSNLTTIADVNGLINTALSNRVTDIFRTFQLWSASNSVIMAGAKAMRTLDYGNTGVGSWTNTSVTNNQYMYYCSGPTGAGLTELDIGLYEVTANMYKSGAGNISIQVDLYIRTQAGSLTNILTTSPQQITASPLEYIYRFNVTSLVTISKTDSIVLGFRASSVTVNPDLIIGTGYLNVPIPSSQFALDTELHDEINNLSNSLVNTYFVTNTVVVSNTLDFAVPIVLNRVILDDIRMYLSTTNNAPYSKRANLQIFRNSNRRCSKMVYLDTNQLYWAAINTTATAKGSGSNTVADASGVVLNDLYYISDNSLTNEMCRPTNTTATIIYWGSTNLNAYTTTSLVSHVNQFGGFPYYDENNSSQMWFRLTFTTPWTTTVQTVINYGR